MKDQIGAAQTEKQGRRKVSSSQSERDKRAQTESLQLSRTAILNRLNAARNDRYRAQLQLALEHIEGQLQELEKLHSTSANESDE